MNVLEAPENVPLELESGDRALDIEEGRESVSMFISLFFVFGAFSIIAGIVLIVNIFTMLGEERKSEMGMARAVGMQRGHLRKLFVYEGFVYALATSAIGSAVGLVLAYGLITAVGMVLDMGGLNIAEYFTFTPESLLIAYLAGFLLTMVSIYGVTRRISNMNIVRAIRNIPEPLRSRGDKQVFRYGALILAGGGPHAGRDVGGIAGTGAGRAVDHDDVPGRWSSGGSRATHSLDHRRPGHPAPVDARGGDLPL